MCARFRAITGVTQGTGAPPEGGNIAFGLTFEVEGRGVVLDAANVPAGRSRLVVPFSPVSADYFSVMGIPVLAGRGFSPADVRGAPLAIVINQEMATRLWRGDNAVGQRLRLDTGPNDPWYTVVGVVGDVYQFDYAQPRGQLAYYFPISQYGTSAVANDRRPLRNRSHGSPPAPEAAGPRSGPGSGTSGSSEP